MKALNNMSCVKFMQLEIGLLTNSSSTQNHVVFQPTSEQAKYGASDISIERLLQFSFEVNN